VQLVIADTGPINYLILIGRIDLLPALFETVILPAVVRDELKHRKAPPAVQQWIASPPSWAEVRQSASVHDASMEALDAGEEDAIALAVEIHADLILMDDREGVLIARSKGFRVTGTLGILSMAAGVVLSILPRHLISSNRPLFIAIRRSWISCLPTRQADSRDDLTWLVPVSG
jgi:predicted nucleic acid-binding protein